MADLSRAHSRVDHTIVMGWNSTTHVWEDTLLRGRLQAFDRFISDRDFPQRKRILTMAGEQELPTGYGAVRLGSHPNVYLVEHTTLDMADDKVYATTFLLHEAPFHVQICKETVTTLQTGVKHKTGGETVFYDTWIDISRYASVHSKEFALTDFTVYTVSFPHNLVLDTDMYVRRLDTGGMLDIVELYHTLENPTARCHARG